MRPQVIEKFNRLPLKDRAILVTTFGKTVYWKEKNDYRVTLYVIDYEERSGLVEIWYDKYNCVIWDIRMPTYEQLDFYLDTINFTY